MRPTPSVSLRLTVHTSLRFAYLCSVVLGNFFFFNHFYLAYTFFYLYNFCLVFYVILSYPQATVFFATINWAVNIRVCVLFFPRYCAYLVSSNHYNFIACQIPLRSILQAKKL